MKAMKTHATNKNLTQPREPALYGTTGYRLNTSDLNNVLCRASLIAWIRSSPFAGKYIGIYITASHNPADFNGIKFIDFNGAMLDESWEACSNDLVNCSDKEIKTVINKIFRQNSNYSGMHEAIRGNVLIGRDTRTTGEELSSNIKEVLREYKCGVHDYGVLSCPEIHFLVRKSNDKGAIVDSKEYIGHISESYKALQDLIGNSLPISVDTANGIAYEKLVELQRMQPDLDVEVLNKSDPAEINQGCGADYVKTRKVYPRIKSGANPLVASFDGDMDRMIFIADKQHISDGDAQCVFLATYIRSLVQAAKLNCTIGVIMSFYSNMGAVEHLKKNFNVTFAQTGIKNFVRESRNYDIGIFFEPAGHGTVAFSKKVLDQLNGDSPEKRILKVLSSLFGYGICDALANFIVFKVLLKSASDFVKYKENVSRLLTVTIADKNKIKVDQNNNVIEPDIQKLISQASSMYKGRGFIRPSGTEDVVRIYAECSQEAQSDKLALNIAQIVYDTCGGIGAHPEIFYLE